MPALASSTRYGEAVIAVEHLCKRFDQQIVLEDLSFEVRRGETVVILGRSGTGKSVTLKTIIGLLDPSAGQVRVLGRNLHRMGERERLRFRRDIGYVFQGAALFDSLSVLENVGFPLYQRGLAGEEIEEAVRKRLEMVGLGHAMRKYPSELSGGMRKRVGLARAIIDLPPIVLYDEPTSGLDPLTTDVINQIILRLRAQLAVTSVVVTHDMASAFTIADRIIMLDQGRIVIDGTPQEVRACENPWVQHFIQGEALESERIDTGRFALPSGFTSRIPASRRIAVVSQGEHLSGAHQIPPSIRTRRQAGAESRRLGAHGAHRPPVGGERPTPSTTSLADETHEAPAPEGVGMDSGGLHPVAWSVEAIDLDDESGSDSANPLERRVHRQIDEDRSS